jgi:hypothetical protein
MPMCQLPDVRGDIGSTRIQRDVCAEFAGVAKLLV